MSTLALTVAEFCVASAWLDREVVQRAGQNLRGAIVDAAELAALMDLAAAMNAQIALWPSEDRTLLHAARVHLTPVETALDIETSGAYALDGRIVEGDHSFDLDADCEIALPDDVLLVLFEFLCREIDDREGRNLGASFVSVAEFWALNSAQCVLEKGSFYSTLRDYREQLEFARKALSSRAPIGFVPLGAED